MTIDEPPPTYLVRSVRGTVHRAVFTAGNLTGTGCGIPFDRLAWPYWHGEPSALTCRAAACRGHREPSPAPAELSDADNDLLKLAAALIREAQRRGWCSEYEHFARHTNAELSKPRLTLRAELTIYGGRCAICGGVHP